jgi:preprotein translocase subunit Sss1
MEILGPVIFALGLSGFLIAVIMRARKEQDNDQD